ncbi:MAG: hypothetical protein FJ191_10435 [Gammaproteobacteria bacterium]|nr:hypothetical protein [Gammaproteobacteria bacterium]
MRRRRWSGRCRAAGDVTLRAVTDRFRNHVVGPDLYLALLPADAAAAEMQDMQVLALLRVPAAMPASYAGDLVINIVTGGLQLRDLAVSYEFRDARVNDRRDEARRELERLYGPLPGRPAIRLMVAGPETPAFRDPELAGRARQLLDRSR